MKKTHLRAYKGSFLTVCGREAKGIVGLFATCKTCLMFDGKVPPANYAELMGYRDHVKGVIKNDDTFSTDNEKETKSEQEKTATRDISYIEYKFLDHLDRKAIDPRKIKSDRSRIINDAVEFNFGETKKIVPGNYGIQKKI